MAPRSACAGAALRPATELAAAADVVGKVGRPSFIFLGGRWSDHTMRDATLPGREVAGTHCKQQQVCETKISRLQGQGKARQGKARQGKARQQLARHAFCLCLENHQGTTPRERARKKNSPQAEPRCTCTCTIVPVDCSGRRTVLNTQLFCSRRILDRQSRARRRDFGGACVVIGVVCVGSAFRRERTRRPRFMTDAATLLVISYECVSWSRSNLACCLPAYLACSPRSVPSADSRTRRLAAMACSRAR